MITSDIWVWTKRGWLNPGDLMVGDIVISYNPKRNCTEYDTIQHIHQEYGTNGLFGIQSKSMSMLVTKDHPVIVYNKQNNEAYRKPMDDIFMSYMVVGNNVLYNRWFEPYHITKDLDDLAWSARLTASFWRTKYMPAEYLGQIWPLIEDIHGIEAQHWIDVFFHWNILKRGVNWMKTIRLRNRDVRDMIFHVAPRAGVGAQFMPNPIKKPGNPWLMSVSTTGDLALSPAGGWFKERRTGSTFNIKTSNGSFLAKRQSGTFICACDLA